MLYNNISSKCDEKNIQNFNDFIYEHPIAEMIYVFMLHGLLDGELNYSGNHLSGSKMQTLCN